MKKNSLIFTSFFLLVATVLALADPVEKPEADEGKPSPEEKPSLFSPDPKRLQKANQVNAGDFEKKLQLEPNPFPLQAVHDAGGNSPSVKVIFTLRNTAKRAYLLFFPTAQRYEITLKNKAGDLFYKWSEDKEFGNTAGAILANQNDKITFSELLPLNDFSMTLVPGNYEVEVHLSAYPDLSAKAQLQVQP